jgi:hypothetical protein
MKLLTTNTSQGETPMAISLATICIMEFQTHNTDNTYEEFIALKGVEWNEEKEATGNQNLSFEEFMLTPFIDEALAWRADWGLD